MNAARRKFITFMSVMGFVSVSGIPLFASQRATGVYVDHTHLADDCFDPDGWL